MVDVVDQPQSLLLRDKLPSVLHPYFEQREGLNLTVDLVEGSRVVRPAVQGIYENTTWFYPERKYLPVQVGNEWQLMYESGSQKEWRVLIAALPRKNKEGIIISNWWVKGYASMGTVPWPLHRFLVAAENKEQVRFIQNSGVDELELFRSMGGVIGSTDEAVDMDSKTLKADVAATQAGRVYSNYSDRFHPENCTATGKLIEPPDFTQPPSDMIFNGGTLDAVWETPHYRLRANFDPRVNDTKKRSVQYINHPSFKPQRDALVAQRSTWFWGLPPAVRQQMTNGIPEGVWFAQEVKRGIQELEAQQQKISFILDTVFTLEHKDPSVRLVDVPTYHYGQGADPLFWVIVKELEKTEVGTIMHAQHERLTPEKATELFGGKILG